MVVMLRHVRKIIIYIIKIREGDKNLKGTFLQSFTMRGAGGWRKCKRLRGFSISHAFVSVFQKNPGYPKHALELRDYVKYMFSFFIPLFIMVWNLRFKK